MKVLIYNIGFRYTDFIILGKEIKKKTNWLTRHFCFFRITAFRRAWDYCFSYPKILHRSPPSGRVVVTGGEIRSRSAKGQPHNWGGPHRWRSRRVISRLTDFKRPQLGALLKKTKFTFLIFPSKIKLIVDSKCGTTPPLPQVTLLVFDRVTLRRAWVGYVVFFLFSWEGRAIRILLKTNPSFVW